MGPRHGRRRGQAFHCWCSHGGKMLLWKYHPSSGITEGWSKTPILSNLVTKFPLMSVRTGIWLFNLQENLMDIYKTDNNTSYQLFSRFPAPLLYLPLKLVYRKDFHHFLMSLIHLHMAMPSFFVFLYALCTVQLVFWMARCSKNCLCCIEICFSIT